LEFWTEEKLIKILEVADGYGEILGKGPLETVVLNISKQLAAMGHEVTIFERRHSEDWPKEEYVSDVKIVRLDKRRAGRSDLFTLQNPISIVKMGLDGLLFSWKFSRFVKKQYGDSAYVIHVHFPLSAMFLIFVNKKLRDKIIFTCHADEYRLGLSSRLKPSFSLKVFSPDIFLMKRLKKITLLNEPLMEKLISDKKIDPKKLIAIGNGVDISTFTSAPLVNDFEDSYGLDNRPIVLFVGAITRRKGVEYLVKAADIIVNKLGRKDIQFALVGRHLPTGVENEYYLKVTSLVESLHLQGNVKLLDIIPRETLIKLYAACAVFVLPSLEEGFGLVVTEAMASGKPIVGTNVSGISSQVKNGWNGFLVEPTNEQQLAEKILKVVDDSLLKKEFGKNSRLIVEEKFTWQKIASKYESVYQSVIMGDPLK
jgi:glycosyltransferase involved in cell wall biosynthesis